MSILVLAEHNNEILKEATKKAITAASQIDKPVHVLVAGTDCTNAAKDAAMRYLIIQVSSGVLLLIGACLMTNRGNQ